MWLLILSLAVWAVDADVELLGARPDKARWVVGGLGGALTVTLVVFVRNWFGGIALWLLIGASFLLLLRRLQTARLFVTQMLGIQFCLASFGSFNYMFTPFFLNAVGERVPSDTQQIAEGLAGPYWLWGGVIALFSILVLGGAFYVAWVRPMLESAAKSGADLDAISEELEAEGRDPAA